MLAIATFFLYPMMKVKEIEANTVIEFQISDFDISLFKVIFSLSPALWLGVSPRGFPMFFLQKKHAWAERGNDMKQSAFPLAIAYYLMKINEETSLTLLRLL